MEHNLTSPINDKYCVMHSLNSPELQKNFLKDLITLQESSSGFFIVFCMESGAGKSMETNRIIGEYIKDVGSRRFLIVKKFREDVIGCADNIKEIACSPNAAIGITADEWKDIRMDLSSLLEYQVIVITHKRYMGLSLDRQNKDVL